MVEIKSVKVDALGDDIIISATGENGRQVKLALYGKDGFWLAERLFDDENLFDEEYDNFQHKAEKYIKNHFEDFIYEYLDEFDYYNKLAKAKEELEKVQDKYQDDWIYAEFSWGTPKEFLKAQNDWVEGYAEDIYRNANDDGETKEQIKKKVWDKYALKEEVAEIKKNDKVKLDQLMVWFFKPDFDSEMNDGWASYLEDFDGGVPDFVEDGEELIEEATCDYNICGKILGYLNLLRDNNLEE